MKLTARSSSLAGPKLRVATRRSSDEPRQIRIGYLISPVQLNLHHKNRALVGLGSYIVNAQAGCNDCHSCPSYAPVSPSNSMRKIIWLEECHSVPFTSRNLTPEENGLPAGMTFEQFKLVIRTGVDLDKAHPQFGPLLQVMPWPVYQSMTDRDLRAIYEYLSAIPRAHPGTCTGAGQ